MLPEVNLYSQDPNLIRKIFAYLGSICTVHHIDSSDEAHRRVKPDDPTLMIIDMCSDSATELIQHTRRGNQHALIIAMGTPRSEPMLQAETFDVYAVEDSEIDRKRFQGLVRRALDYLNLIDENRSLRDELASSASLMQLSSFLSNQSSPKDMYYLRQFTKAFVSMRDRSALVDAIIEGIRASVGVSRIGIFSFSREFGHYELCADYRCLQQTSDLSFSESDPLVQFLETSSHIVSSQGLNHLANPSVRRMLRQNLDVFGADVIVPLQVNAKLLGWLFLGQRVTGQQFSNDDLENLMIIGELVSALLYNSVLHEQFSIQGDLFDALINSIMFGIVAVSEDEKIRYINQKAMDYLGVSGAFTVNHSIDKLGALTNVLRGTLHDSSPSAPFVWRDPRTDKKFTIFVRRLERNDALLGAMALIREGESDTLLDEGCAPALEHHVLDRDIAHEIKNQLVAINTFIQLLPERYDDPEFRQQFCEIATSEIARIKDLISNAPEETPISN